MGEDRGKMDGCQKARVVDWEEFQEQREREKQEGPIEDIGPYGSVDDSVPEPSRVDSRLAHLVEAKKSMQRKVSQQKLNRKIRKKIAEINREMEAHCVRLCEQEWQECAIR
ncbi:hypothetical protein HPB51_012245 [Rhipicephalus microplus]|uniref:Uncharacterized protein n=1 Tax=Rhipicephalus microplus TaxID=6941 RepID=A0A9J6DMU9_RHIMP|nr:hypothetical protein HPB51_012245 [Rhipicephalus microplus]